jgi:hypothetical protein
VHVLVDHDDEPIAGPDLQGVRDRQAGTRVSCPSSPNCWPSAAAAICCEL